ncbi:MAG: hypothetical protein MUO73_04095, partial [Thermoplasmata archaeon]|nr:hypothetical protein [Thermoplasmata archaeon]
QLALEYEQVDPLKYFSLHSPHTYNTFASMYKYLWPLIFIFLWYILVAHGISQTNLFKAPLFYLEDFNA